MMSGYQIIPFWFFLKCTVMHIILPASLVSVTECDNQEKLGSIVNVDFMTINQPCNCEVKPQFSGDLVFASNVVLYDCYTEVTIRRNTQNDDIFAVRCPKTHSSKMYSVSNSSVFEISSTYLRRTGDTSFHQSIQIFQGNYKNNNPQKEIFMYYKITWFLNIILRLLEFAFISFT